MTTTTTTPTATDAQAARNILDANPGMLWQSATHADGQKFPCRFAGDHYEVLLNGSDGVAVTTWEKWHFAMRFTLEGHLAPDTSAQIDQALFSGMLKGRLQTITVQ